MELLKNVLILLLALQSLVSTQMSIEPRAITKLIRRTEKNFVTFINCDEKLINSFSTEHNARLLVEIHSLNQTFKTRQFKISSAVIRIRSIYDFDTILPLFRPEAVLHDGHFIIVLENAISGDIERMFSKLWKIYVYNVNVITTSANSTNTISLYTFKPFINDFSCDNTKPIKINEFDGASMRWRSDEFFPEKFKNLHACPLRVGSFENRPGFFTTMSRKGERIFTGIDSDLVNFIGKVLNFKPTFRIYPRSTGAIYKNKSSTGLLKRAYENEVDVIIGSLSLQQSRAEYLSETRMIYTDKLILVVPPPFLISSLAKIVLPFHLYSWIAVVLVVLIACVAIIVLKFTPRVYHNYIVGVNVNSSLLGVWNLLLGGAQVKVPKSNFPRFLLAKFLIFALVIRSLYQGAIFGILKNEISTVELNTIDEFIENKFTFFIYDSLAARLNGTKFLERHKVINLAEISAFEDATLDPAFKGVVFDYLTIALYTNFLSRKNFTYKICKESLLTNQIVFYFTKNFYLVDEFNDLIENLKAVGLIEHLLSQYIDMELMNLQVTKQGATALTLEQLNGIFQLLVYGLALALAVFVAEVLHGLFKRVTSR